MKKTAIIVSYHKNAPIIRESSFIPMHVGYAAGDNNSDWPEDILNDAAGDNISAKNPNYCELTSIYWAWKNYAVLGNPEHIGFFHYRRFLNFNTGCFNLTHNWVYNDFGKSSSDKFGWHNKQIDSITDKYDLVLPLPEKLISNISGRNLTVAEHYAESHYKEDFTLLMNVLLELYPEHAGAINCTASSNKAYFCNLFIMKKDIFLKYAAFLFKILERVESKINLKSEKYTDNSYQSRIFGFLGERLLNFFIAIEQKQNSIRIKELQMLLGDFERKISKPRLLLINLARKAGFRIYSNAKESVISFGKATLWRRKK